AELGAGGRPVRDARCARRRRPDPHAAADSAAVTRMRRAGLVIVGRTNTSEFGLAPTTEPAFGGPTINPWRKDLSPGGSSGGSAAIV
ncbi:amidase family protein, partial [Streptomyces galilaeus]|uniref:amidase family protein n=1 Tax=Streptomyces galilaeus TaxID=33899 RepID=UPI0038F78307